MTMCYLVGDAGIRTVCMVPDLSCILSHRIVEPGVTVSSVGHIRVLDNIVSILLLIHWLWLVITLL